MLQTFKYRLLPVHRRTQTSDCVLRVLRPAPAVILLRKSSALCHGVRCCRRASSKRCPAIRCNMDAWLTAKTVLRRYALIRQCRPPTPNGALLTARVTSSSCTRRSTTDAAAVDWCASSEQRGRVAPRRCGVASGIGVRRMALRQQRRQRRQRTHRQLWWPA